MNITIADGKKKKDGYIVCGMCMKELGCWAICEACFCTRYEKEKKVYSSCEDCEGFND